MQQRLNHMKNIRISLSMVFCLILGSCTKYDDTALPPVKEYNSIAEHVQGNYSGTASGGDVGQAVAAYKVYISMVNDTTVEINAEHLDAAILALTKKEGEALVRGSNDSLHLLYEIDFHRIGITENGFLKFSFTGTKPP